MKLDKLVGERFKEKPADCVIDSHILMLRGGYMKYVANGIYSAYPLLKRITHKIEQIIREEMDAIDGQEVSFPVVMPASLWQRSGRYESIGSELVRFTDRSKSPLVLGMTHEEAAVQLVDTFGQSYTKYPFMIYQIQTKFRDEARPRAGLIRVREFTMKDGYSFHLNQADLENYYNRCLKAYERIYTRVGIPEVVAVASDSGMMGGNLSHEFMLLTPIGEDSIAICKDCGFKANMEAAKCIYHNEKEDNAKELKLVPTPNVSTIADVCSFFNTIEEKICKAVVYQKNLDGQHIVVFIRGDLEVNETKLTNQLGCSVHPAEITDECGLSAGYIGPYELNNGTIALFDNSLANINNLICGGNQTGFHYTGLDIQRDIGQVSYNDFAKITEGSVCPCCGKLGISISRGIEVGNIFQLGTKYTRAMGMTYLDQDGSSQYPVMGCYGIGIGRLAASVCEARHDKYGPIWPMAIAPWQVHLCAVRADNADVKKYADSLYEDLMHSNVEVIYDDRPLSAGIMFSDADLLGIPLRVIISPRNLEEQCCEITTRDKSFSIKVPMAAAKENILNLIAEIEQANQ